MRVRYAAVIGLSLCFKTRDQEELVIMKVRTKDKHL